MRVATTLARVVEDAPRPPRSRREASRTPEAESPQHVWLLPDDAPWIPLRALAVEGVAEDSRRHPHIRQILNAESTSAAEESRHSVTLGCVGGVAPVRFDRREAGPRN